MVSDDLFWRILWLHGHGQVIVAYRPHSVPAEGLAGYFAVITLKTNLIFWNACIFNFAEKIKMSCNFLCFTVILMEKAISYHQ